MFIKHLFATPIYLAAIITLPTNAIQIVNDDFADLTASDDTNNTTDARYFGASAGSAIEFNNGSIGLVTGSSGRTLNAFFPSSQTLAADGDSITVSVTFVTPSTIGPNDDMRIGLYNSLERPELLADTGFSTTGQNISYVGLPGFYTELDVDTSGNQDIDTRVSEPSRTGRHSSTSTGFDDQGGDDNAGYMFEPNTQYTFTHLVERIGDDLSITGTLDFPVAGVAQSFSETVILDGGLPASEDPNPATFEFNIPAMNSGATPEVPGTPLAPIADSYTIDMFSIGASGGAFGSSNVGGEVNNGIDIIGFTVDANIAGGAPVPTIEEETCYTTSTPDGGSAAFCL